VAIKTRKKRMKANKFFAEAIKMKHLSHANIVKLHGVHTSSEPLLIVMEFAAGGCLLNYLRSRRGRASTWVQIVQMMADVCCGMAFLQDEHWIHADLAARNLLLGDEQEVKIADFGHAVRTNETDDPIEFVNLLPLRWAAPELFTDMACQPASDVWSFGVVMFEIISRGELPYAMIEEPSAVIIGAAHGWRLPKHKNVPQVHVLDAVAAAAHTSAALLPRASLGMVLPCIFAFLPTRLCTLSLASRSVSSAAVSDDLGFAPLHARAFGVTSVSTTSCWTASTQIHRTALLSGAFLHGICVAAVGLPGREQRD